MLQLPCILWAPSRISRQVVIWKSCGSPYKSSIVHDETDERTWMTCIPLDFTCPFSHTSSNRKNSYSSHQTVWMELTYPWGLEWGPTCSGSRLQWSNRERMFETNSRVSWTDVHELWRGVGQQLFQEGDHCASFHPCWESRLHLQSVKQILLYVHAHLANAK